MLQSLTLAPAVPNAEPWSEPRSVHISCAPDPTQPNSSTLAVSFLACDIDDSYETFVLSIVGHLLVEGSNALFYKTLLETGLGSSFAPVTGIFILFKNF